MSDKNTSGSFPVSLVLAYSMTERFEKLDIAERKLIAELYAMDALWYLSKAQEKKSVKFPAIIKGIGQSPVRYLVNRATSGQDTPEDTAVKARDLFEEFVTQNQEAIGFGGDLKFANRNASKGRLPLALLLEVDRIARPDRVFAEDPRQLAQVMGVILNSGKGAIDNEVHRPGAEFSVLLSKLCPLASDSGVLDMSCGTGTLLSKLLADKSRIRAFGQEVDQELAVISWLRMELHPAAESAHVQVGDPLRYGYTSSYTHNPIDVALVHSIDLEADEEIRASVEQSLREAEENEQQVMRKRAELEYRNEDALKARNKASHAYEDAHRRVADNPTPQAAEMLNEMEKRLQIEEMRVRDLNQQLDSVQGMAFEASRARKAAYERAKKPARDRTYELIKHGLDCVSGSGLTIAVVSARALFKSPQVDRLRAEALENDRLDLVIELPRGVDGAEDRVAVLVFRKGRKNEPILFVDATDHETVKKALRHGPGFEPVLGYRRTRSAILTQEFFAAIASVCLDRVEIPCVSALVPRSDLGGISVDGRQVDLRPRQFILTDRLEEPAADRQTRLAECHRAVASAEAALLKARAKLGLPPLFIPTSSSKPPRQPGN
jgi:SAM-dependent methyltransferase